MCWSSGMAYGPTHRVSCPSRSLNLVCKIPTACLVCQRLTPLVKRLALKQAWLPRLKVPEMRWSLGLFFIAAMDREGMSLSGADAWVAQCDRAVKIVLT